MNVSRLSFSAFFVPDIGAAGLEVLKVGAGGNLNVTVIGRHPYLNIIGLCRRETDIAGAKGDYMVGKAQTLQSNFGLMGQRLQLIVGVVRLDKFDQFDFVELMLTDQPLVSRPALPASARKQAE